MAQTIAFKGGESQEKIRFLIAALIAILFLNEAAASVSMIW